MVFSEFTFLFVFLPFVLLAYFISPTKLKNTVLFICSLAFYGWGEPKFLALMFLTITIHFFAAIFIENLKEKSRIKDAKWLMIAAVIISLAILAVFKYSAFFITNINTLFTTEFSILKLVLPIGISFYTFQTLSYTVDVYKGIVRAQRNFINLGTYVVFFPQLIAGPIVRYETIEAELPYRKVEHQQIYEGICRFVVGLAKKVLIANQIGAVYTQIQEINNASTVTAWIGILSFTFQIYFDFSGYSDMAIGLGKIFGFNFTENFDYPYCSKSVTEFWRRWHMTLGTWFREYVYIPLGGNKCSKRQWLFNLAIVWFLTGLWHGANWNFVIWGLYFAVLLIVEKLWLNKILQKAGSFSHVTTMLAVIIGWVLFSTDTINAAFHEVMLLAGIGTNLIDTTSMYLLMENAVLLLFCIIGSTNLPKKYFNILAKKITNHTVKIALTDVACIAIVVLCVAFLAGDSYNPFLYFRF